MFEKEINDSKDRKVLERFLGMPISNSAEVFEMFRTLPGVIERHGEGKQGYLYVPGTRSDRCILAAHADTVFDFVYKNEFYENTFVFEDGIYRGTNENASFGADDRSGCAILWLLREMGHSLLILDGEEHGQIGAHYLADTNPELFNEINDHSFIIQFDRRGSNDYRYYRIPVTDEFVEYIESETGYKLAEGTGRTDIVALCRDICGVNLSVGYYDEHRPTERLVYSEWENTLNIARKMLARPLIKYPLI